jgi:hypothetical protein
MIHRLTISATLLLAACGLAMASNSPSVRELEARADAARLEDRPELYVEIAQQQLKFASESYKTGKTDEAKAAVADVVRCAGKARDASIQSGKKLKNIEITMRKMAERMRDLKRQVNFDDQAPLQAAADELESMRSDLLSHMFRKGK